MDNRVFDTVIVGGGPTGLFGLFYACLRDMDTLLIDSLPELGGQLSTLYPEKDVYDMPGFPKIRARDLAAQMVEQALMHKKQEIVLGERVDQLTRDDASNTIALVTDKQRTIRAKTVVITTGAGAFRPNKLSLPALAKLEDRS